MTKGLKRFAKYSTIGASTFVFDLILLSIFVEFFAISQVWAAGIAFLIAVSVNYWLSRKYVFRGTLRDVKTGYVNFILIAICGLLLVTGGMYLLTTIFSVHYLIARVIIAVVTGVWNYLLNLFVNFKVAGQHH